MPDNRPRLIDNRHSGCQHAIPELRVFASSSGPGAKTLIQQANPGKSFPAANHVSTSSNTPDGNPPLYHALKENRIQNYRTVHPDECAAIPHRVAMELG